MELGKPAGRDDGPCCSVDARAYLALVRADAEAQRVGLFLVAYLLCFALDVLLSERGAVSVAGLAGDIMRSLVFSCVLAGAMYLLKLAAQPPDERRSYGWARTRCIFILPGCADGDD